MGKRRRKPLFSDFHRINEPWTRERAFWCLFQVTYTNWALDNIITFKSTLHNYLLMSEYTKSFYLYIYFFQFCKYTKLWTRRVQKRLFNEHSTNIKYCSRKAIPWERQFVNWGCNVVARCVWNVKRCGGAEAREVARQSLAGRPAADCAGEAERRREARRRRPHAARGARAPPWSIHPAHTTAAATTAPHAPRAPRAPRTHPSRRATLKTSSLKKSFAVPLLF